MSKEMLINVSEGEECRIALIEEGRLEELYMERTSSTSHVGNVYKGRVTNVEPSIQAAFVDFGLGRNGFLHISDLMPTYFGGKAEDVVESVGRKMARRDRPPIQRCLKRGDEIIVQIIKEGIGTKGPTLSTYISIPGRILVMMPGMTKLGVSRKIEDEEERKRLRTILDQLKPPKDCGFIIRTAGIGKSKTEIERDLKYLTRLYENINKKANSAPGPMELYAEGDLVTRTVRDVMTSDIDRIVVDNKEVAKKIKEFFKLLAPRTKSKVELYEDALPLFHKYDIEREIELMYSRHVPLPSGGSLVIDSTEAIVAIDVNSGKFRDHADAETTAFRTDLEAADEIPRQLRLRDLGGVIICDFIDLRFERHRRELEKRLHENLKGDRAKTKMLRMSQFGIIEMTRQRMRPSLKRSIYCDCPHCHGAGLVKTPESMSLDVMRRLQIAASDQRVVRIELTVSSEVAFYLQNRKRTPLAMLESESGRRILIRVGLQMALDEIRLELFDSRDSLIYLPELGMVPAELPGQQHGGRRDQRDGRSSQRGRRDGREGGREGGRGQRRGRDRRREEPQPEDDRYVEDVEEQVDQREEERAEQAAADAAVEAPLSGDSGRYDDRGTPESDLDDVEAAPVPIEEMGSEADEEEEPVSEDVEPSSVESMPSQDLHTSELEPIESSGASSDRDDEGEESGGGEPPYDEHGGYSEDEEAEVELQPRGISHERPTLKEQAGGGRRGGRGGRGRGGRRQPQPAQPKPELAAPRREGEMSLAERWAMEEAAERARRQQPGGGHRGGQGGGNRGGHGGGQQQHRPQQGGGQGNFQQGSSQGEGGGRRRRRRRRGRGGRGQGGQGHSDGGNGGYGDGPGQAENIDRDNSQGMVDSSAPAVSNEPPAPASNPPAVSEPAPPVQRTGSTDRHLLHDDPVHPQPAHRPRHVRDLDYIPEDD